jgi:hypothetical protein
LFPIEFAALLHFIRIEISLLAWIVQAVTNSASSSLGLYMKSENPNQLYTLIVLNQENDFHTEHPQVISNDFFLLYVDVVNYLSCRVL